MTISYSGTRDFQSALPDGEPASTESDDTQPESSSLRSLYVWLLIVVAVAVVAISIIIFGSPGASAAGGCGGG